MQRDLWGPLAGAEGPTEPFTQDRTAGGAIGATLRFPVQMISPADRFENEGAT